LEFCDQDTVDEFIQEIKDAGADAIFITGDISSDLIYHLSYLSPPDMPDIYFVLGNHDYYGNSFNVIDRQVDVLYKYPIDLRRIQKLQSNNLYTRFSKKGVLFAGVNGWYDFRAGNYMQSNVTLNDFHKINEFIGQTKSQIMSIAQRRADNDNMLCGEILNNFAKEEENKLIFLTHVPPFVECCLHDGKICNDDYLPFFCNVYMGQFLIQFCQNNPHKDILVLCGHTHHKANFKPLPNLEIRVGGATYGKPEIQEIIEI